MKKIIRIINCGGENARINDLLNRKALRLLSVDER